MNDDLLGYEKKRKRPADQQKGLRRRLHTVEDQISEAVDRLVSVADSLVDAVQQKLIELQNERAAIQAQLTNLKLEDKPAAGEIAKRIYELDRVLTSGSPRRVRNALSKIISRITLSFERGEVYHNRRHRWHFTGGEILLHVQDGADMRVSSPAAAS